MHRHHSPIPCDICQDWPDWARHLAAHLNRIELNQEHIMSQQDEINADVTELQSAASAIQGEIAALEARVAAGQPLDLTGLKAQADALAAIVPAPASPPVDDNPPADNGDGSTPAA